MPQAFHLSSIGKTVTGWCLQLSTPDRRSRVDPYSASLRMRRRSPGLTPRESRPGGKSHTNEQRLSHGSKAAYLHKCSQVEQKLYCRIGARRTAVRAGGNGAASVAPVMRKDYVLARWVRTMRATEGRRTFRRTGAVKGIRTLRAQARSSNHLSRGIGVE